MPVTRTAAPPVARWVRVAAYAIPLCVLPSAAWRLTIAIDAVIGEPSPCIRGGALETAYIALLSIVSLGAALLMLGLVRPWGEVAPAWLPVIGGRPLPARAVTAAAAAGATALTLITVFALLNAAIGFSEARTESLPPGCEPPGDAVAVLYAPLLAWAPLTWIVIHQYHRRRSAAAR
jgi:hypothetical protein